MSRRLGNSSCLATVALGMIVSQSGCSVPATIQSATVRDIADISEKWHRIRSAVSQDGSVVVWVTATQTGYVVEDSRKSDYGMAFDRVDYLGVTADGAVTACVGERSGSTVLLLNGRTVDGINKPGVVQVSTDGSAICGTLELSGGQRAFAVSGNGAIYGPVLPAVGEGEYSATSHTLAYTERTSDGWVMVVGSARSKAYTFIGGVRSSRAHKVIFVGGANGGKRLVHLRDSDFVECPLVDDVVFNGAYVAPMSGDIYWTGVRDGKMLAFRNGVLAWSADGMIDNMAFASDGEVLGVTIVQGKKWQVMTGDGLGREFVDVTHLKTAEDSNHFGFIGYDNSGVWLYTDQRACLLRFRVVKSLMIISCIQAAAYVGIRDHQAYAVVNGMECGPFLHVSPPRWNAALRKIEFTGLRNGKMQMIEFEYGE